MPRRLLKPGGRLVYSHLLARARGRRGADRRASCAQRGASPRPHSPGELCGQAEWIEPSGCLRTFPYELGSTGRNGAAWTGFSPPGSSAPVNGSASHLIGNALPPDNAGLRMRGAGPGVCRGAGRQLGDNEAWRLILSPTSAVDAVRRRAQAARAPFAASCSRAWRALSYPGSQAEQLLLAPQELRTADPSFATELYNGHFGLAGRLAEVEAESPFEIDPPSEGWARELYGFGWLRHLRAAGNELSREQAKALVHDFVRLRRSESGLAWQPEIVGRRVISWLSNSVLVLDSGRAAGLRGVPQGAHRAAPLSLGELSRLAGRRSAPRLPHGADLCRALHRRATGGGRPLYAALLQGARPADPARRRAHLAQSRGAHRAAARPSAAQAMFRRARPRAAQRADRRHRPHHADAPLLPHRRRDACALQWRGPTPTDALATVLAYDDMEGTPVRSAANSGYVRLELGTTLFLCDIGPAPAPSLSIAAHAGFLSFEMSSGDCPMIVNCGSPSRRP